MCWCNPVLKVQNCGKLDCFDPDKFEVKDKTTEDLLRDLGRAIKGPVEAAGGTFSLFLCIKGGTFYLSSARRGDMVKGLHEFIEDHERDQPTSKCASCGCPASGWKKNEDGKGYQT